MRNMVYYIATNEEYENFCHRSGYDVGMEATPAMGRLKADLIAEGARFAQRNGLSEVRVCRVTCETKRKVREGRCIVTKTLEKPLYHLEQTWYVYQDNGEWFFKMYGPQTKTAHKVVL